MAVSKGCDKSGKAAAPWLWDLWMETCGPHLKEGVDPELLLGQCARNLVPVCGPLHCYLNSATDALNFYGDIFLRPFYLHWTGGKLHDKPKVRQTITLLEVMYSGYLKIRPSLLLEVDKLQAKANRADVATYAHLPHIPRKNGMFAAPTPPS